MIMMMTKMMTKMITMMTMIMTIMRILYMIMIIMRILFMMMVFRYGDLAVGAPYSGVDGVGAVFVFRGGSSGVREQPDQVSSKSSS